MSIIAVCIYNTHDPLQSDWVQRACMCWTVGCIKIVKYNYVLIVHLNNIPFYISLLHLQLLIIYIYPHLHTLHYHPCSHLIITHNFHTNEQASVISLYTISDRNNNDFYQNDTCTMHKNIMNTHTIIQFIQWVANMCVYCCFSNKTFSTYCQHIGKLSARIFKRPSHSQKSYI